MIHRLAVTLLGLFLVAQLLLRIVGEGNVTSPDYTATERGEPSRLLSGSSLPHNIATQVNGAAVSKCTIVVFASPTCEGCSILAQNWNHEMGEPIWVFDGEDRVVEDFRQRHSLTEGSSIQLRPTSGLSELGVFATPTWGFADSTGVIHTVRVSSSPPLPSDVPDVCK